MSAHARQHELRQRRAPATDADHHDVREGPRREGTGTPPPGWADDLLINRPDLSAGTPMWLWQKITLGGLAAALLATLAFSPGIATTAMLAVLTPLFLCVVAIRGLALYHFINVGPRRQPLEPASAASDADLPLYSVLVPLYHEDSVIPALLRALANLDWPRDKLDIVFITEAHDVLTQKCLARGMDAAGAHLTRGMRIVTVPSGQPQTKPRALTYALALTRGALVTVYDAEDEPEPDQLRRAHAVLSGPGSQVGCVQARLNVYNRDQSGLSRQFTLEYTALFDAILPALRWLGLPIPLGGTSNHFRRDVLDAAGGWDPYNVTEDADLGIRLARAGWTIEVLPSTTWEEAPATLPVWFGQRVRWLKGWMQTCLVHLRQPRVLRRELGTRAFLGFLVLMGGMILSALVHPMAYVALAAAMVSGPGMLSIPDGGWEAVAWWGAVVNLAAAYVVGGGLAVVASRRRHGHAMVRQALLIPFYWLLISAAAYRALVELAVAPYHWRKTAHRGRLATGAAPP